jgi:hypothetical protein
MIRTIAGHSLIGILFCVASVGCSGEGSATAANSQASTEQADTTSASPAENVDQYEDCLIHGRTSSVELAGLATFNNPPTSAVFEVAECIIGHLKNFHGKLRPYHLQSYKTLSVDNAHQTVATTFFFKRYSEGSNGEAAPECLKVKLDAQLGATDFFVTIKRVKQLASTTPNGLCSDNGET